MPDLFALLKTYPDATVSGVIGIAGALIGSSVSVTWTEFFNWRARRRDLRERQAVGAFALYQKLNIIYSAACFTKKHLEEGVAKAKAGKSPQLFLSTAPIAGPVQEVEFTIDELWVAKQIGHAELLNSVTSLDRVYNVIAGIMARYDREYHALLLELQPEQDESGRLSFELTPERLKKYKARFAQLDAILTQTNQQNTELYVRSFDSLRLVAHSKLKPLGIQFSVSFVDTEGNKIDLKAVDSPHFKKAPLPDLLHSMSA